MFPVNQNQTQTQLSAAPNQGSAAPIAVSSVPTPAPAAPAAAQLPVTHQDHPFWTAVLKTLTILAAVAPPVVAIVTHNPAAATEAQQLGQLSGAIFQGLQAGE
jgi:hypothetical protein